MSFSQLQRYKIFYSLAFLMPFFSPQSYNCEYEQPTAVRHMAAFRHRNKQLFRAEPNKEHAHGNKKQVESLVLPILLSKQQNAEGERYEHIASAH
jgi:hypothetical protein